MYSPEPNSVLEDNAIIRIWSEKVQSKKGDSLAKDCVSELWDYTRISVAQNSLQELKEIWDKWNDETNQLFYSNYGVLTYLLDIKVDEQLFRVLAQYWNPAYSCFTFGKVDLVPMVEEYTALLHCPKLQWITARIKQKGECKCIPWKNLRDFILADPDRKKKVDVFALSIYGLVIFPRALGHVDEAVSDLFDRLGKGVTPVDKVSYRVFSEHYSPLKEIMATPRTDDISEKNWMAILQNLQEEDIEWRAPWLIPDRILYHCGGFDWVSLLRIWGAIEYAPLLAIRQYNSRQFVLATNGLAQCKMKRLVVGLMTTPEYDEWRSKRTNDNILELNIEGVRPMEEYLQAILSELDIIKQDFEKKNLELEKKLERLEEEKMHLRLDVDVQKLEAERLKKGKNKAEEDLDSLKTDYKKLRVSMRTAGLGKTSEQWRQEI
ncbi:hypothetical protein Goshw_009529 [Gossypium schwendimanii]|uniref:DUF7745 domain-containing protein n=2 Tax=Gossypium schwendimanii TaxID=34291 RepID=A0A7J9MYM9_GOSSC|nr:hypothetical protein [Gossypium schwendimanii]